MLVETLHEKTVIVNSNILLKGCVPLMPRFRTYFCPDLSPVLRFGWRERDYLSRAVTWFLLSASCFGSGTIKSCKCLAMSGRSGGRYCDSLGIWQYRCDTTSGELSFSLLWGIHNNSQKGGMRCRHRFTFKLVISAMLRVKLALLFGCRSRIQKRCNWRTMSRLRVHNVPV